MPVVIKSIDQLINKLSKPSICEYVYDNYEQIEYRLFECIYNIDIKKGSTIIDTDCSVRFIPLEAIEEFMIESSVTSMASEVDTYGITDRVKDRGTAMMSGSEFYLESVIDHIKSLGERKRDELPSIIIIEFNNGKRDILFGTARYLKSFFGL